MHKRHPDRARQGPANFNEQADGPEASSHVEAPGPLTVLGLTLWRLREKTRKDPCPGEEPLDGRLLPPTRCWARTSDTNLPCCHCVRLPGLDAIGQVEAAVSGFDGDELKFATPLDPTEQRRPASQDERVHD